MSRYCLRASHTPSTTWAAPRTLMRSGFSTNHIPILRVLWEPTTHSRECSLGARNSMSPSPSMSIAKAYMSLLFRVSSSTSCSTPVLVLHQELADFTSSPMRCSANFAITAFSEVGLVQVCCCLPTAAPPCGRFGSAHGCAEGRLRPPLAHAVCAQGIPRPPPSSRSLPATRPSGRHSQTLLLPGPPTPAALREARTPGLSPCSVPRLASGILLLLKGFSLFRSEAGRGSYCRRHHLGAPEVTLLHLGSGYLAS